jgi:beta-1,4-mannosyltransferase
MPGTQPIQSVRFADNIVIHHVPQLPLWCSKLPTLIGLLLKAVFQFLAMLWLMLFKLPTPQAILMQNPPAIPSMLVCWVAAKRHGASWIIDWHNFAYSIMQLKYARHGWLIALAKGFEKLMGCQAQQHFCVTAAMKQFLESEFGLSAVVLYDRPPSMFHRCSLEEVHDLFQRLQPQLQQQGIGQCLQKHLAVTIAADGQTSSSSGGGGSSSSSVTLVTSTAGEGHAALRQGRPAIVVSSTSWTPDEDFGILLSAAQIYDQTAATTGQDDVYPDVVFIITGRGPDRDKYIQRIRQLQLHKVAFCSLWLEPEDYPLMLGAADLGVCLHTSSSGLDLPMKVVDMYGAGLPVCAVDYECIDELVIAGKTGLLFQDAQELAQQLLELLKHFPNSTHGKLAQMHREVLREHSAWRWTDNWDKVAAPVLAAESDRHSGRPNRPRLQTKKKR